MRNYNESVTPRAKRLEPRSRRTPRARRPCKPLRGLRPLLRGVRELDRVTTVAITVQWVAALFIAHTLMDSGAVSRSVSRLLLVAGASLCGPLTCFGVVRAMRRLRSQRFQREHLLHCVQHDELTGLPNRAAMQQHLAEILRKAASSGTPLQCMYLDLDGLRHANALLGYRAGDDLLQQIVSRVANCLNPTDHFSRFGGDKFVVLLHRSISRSELNALAECMVHTISRPHSIKGRDFTTGVSIGIASYPGDASNTEALLAAAERAMYLVKRSGRDSYRHAEQSTEPVESRGRILADKLQRALLNEELRLVYQPIYDQHGRIVAAEALARWHDPEDGNISPAEFIPVAEETGLIVPLSTWVLRRACRQMCQWRIAGAAIRRIAVNICVLQVAREDFVRTIETVLQESGLPPDCLELEVTEGALARDFTSVKAHLQELRDLGVRISIDDFGTGYSSFGRLRELNADALKIDRVFVQGAHDTHNGIVVLQALIEMAHTLNLSVVAEGVETAEQMEMLRSLHCNEMQGFLLARPQEPDQLHNLLLAPEQHTVNDDSDETAAYLLPGFA